MKRVVFLCTAAAGALAAQLPLGFAPTRPARLARTLGMAYHGAGRCQNHRPTMRWSGYAMHDVLG